MVQLDHHYTYIPSAHFSNSAFLPICFHFNYFHLKWYTFAKKNPKHIGCRRTSGQVAFSVLEDRISFNMPVSISFRAGFWGPIFGKFIKLHISQFCCSFLFNDAIWIQAHIQESWNGASLWNLVSEFLIILDYEFCITHHILPPDTHMLSLQSPLATADLSQPTFK